MTIPPQGLLLFSLVLIQFLRVLQSNLLLLILPCRIAMGEIIVVGTSYPSAVVAHLVLGQPWCHLLFHSRMKHLVIDYHFVHDLVQSSKLRVVHISAGDQLIDGLTKSLSRSRLFYLCNKICVISGFGTPS